MKDNKVKKDPIIKKLKKWLLIVEKLKDPQKAVETFDEMFSGEYNFDFIKDDYSLEFEYYEDIYMLKNNISLSVVTGDFHRLKNKPSHKGMDLYLSYNFYNYAEDNSIFLFVESKIKDFKSEVNKFLEKIERSVKSNEQLE